MDSKGVNIGEKDNEHTVLTSHEWKNATIRGLSNDEKMIKLKVIAQSKEQSNGLTANSEALTLDWKVTPVIDDEGYAFIEIPEKGTKSGIKSDITLTLEVPTNALYSIASIKVPEGTELEIEENHKISSQKNKDNNEIVEYRIEINKELLDKNKGKLKLGITAADDFKGLLQGELNVYSSLRRDNASRFEGEILEKDIRYKLASHIEESNFEWNVIMVAKEPEILLEDKEGMKKVGVDFKSGKVTIPIRRGASKNGIRNPDESISITISNIPDGYYLAQRVGEKYEQIGATDTFGTITLFSKSKESPDRSQEELSKYQLLNDGNLYLVKRYDQAFIEDGSKLKIEVNSLISDEGSSDSRSDKSTEYINITGVETPKYNRINNFIDPLIIDIDRDNRFELTSLDNSHVKFNMIPGKGLMNTGWISDNENKNNKNAAFIV